WACCVGCNLIFSWSQVPGALCPPFSPDLSDLTSLEPSSVRSGQTLVTIQTSSRQCLLLATASTRPYHQAARPSQAYSPTASQTLSQPADSDRLRPTIPPRLGSSTIAPKSVNSARR